MSDTTFVNIEGLDEAQELKSVPAGEYQVRVTDAKIKTGEKGTYLMLVMDLPNEPLSKNINHVMMFPTPADDPKRANNRKLAIRNALQACGIPYTGGFNAADLIGSTPWALLTEEEDNEYGKQNRVKKWIASR